MHCRYIAVTLPAKASALTAALSDAAGRCCNAVTFGAKDNGDPIRILMCRGVGAPDSHTKDFDEKAQGSPLGSGWLSIIGGGSVLTHVEIERAHARARARAPCPVPRAPCPVPRARARAAVAVPMSPLPPLTNINTEL